MTTRTGSQLPKLAGLLDVSNEAWRDRSYNLTDSLRRILADSFSPDLDQGLLYGTGDPQPVGVVANAPAASGATLLAALAVAYGSIADAGGTPNTIAMSGTAMAEANFTADEAGALAYPGGFGQAVALRPVKVPGLEQPLVYDSTRMILILNGEMSSVEVTDAYHWQYDAMTFRVRCRCAVACPVPNKRSASSSSSAARPNRRTRPRPASKRFPFPAGVRG